MILHLKEPDFALTLHLIDNSKLEEVLQIIEAAAYGEALKFAQGNVTHASKLLRVTRNTFKKKLKRFTANEIRPDSNVIRGRIRNPL